MAELYDRLKNDKLSDNTQMHYCEQCKECKFWGKSGTAWDNKHDKSNCAKFPYPNMKPIDVINNRMPCPERKING